MTSRSCAAFVGGGATPKRARHVGRYKRRESQKDVRAYSSEDLTAILCGVNARAADSPAPAKAQPPKPAPQPAYQVRTFELAPLPKNWWGFRHGFVREGDGTGAGPETADDDAELATKRRMFSEQDQEDLYNAAHEAAVSGKRGLGRAKGGVPQGPSKLRDGSAADYEGNKTTFDDADDDEVSAATGEGSAKEKWRRVAMDILASSKKGHASGKGVRMDWLESRLLKAAPDAASGAKLAKKLRKCKSFDVLDAEDGARVRIACR